MEEKIQQLTAFYKTHKRLPSYREMMELFGYRSKNAVKRVVDTLIERGVLARDDGMIVPRSLYGNVKMVGAVSAGFPSPAEEELADSISLEEWLIENKSATFMLTVSGDSMKDAGILEGDTVLVERTNSPKVGEIVIAEVDGEWTMKYLRKKHGRYYLEAANDKYSDVYPEDELNIPATVKAVLRKY